MTMALLIQNHGSQKKNRQNSEDVPCLIGMVGFFSHFCDVVACMGGYDSTRDLA
jgi:hypothetical protein